MPWLGTSKLIHEARRRRLFGVITLYVVAAWIVLQVAALAFPGWGIPDSAIRYVWVGAIILFPVALVFGWRYDVSAGGIRKTVATNSDYAAVAIGRIDYWVLPVLSLLCISVVVGVVNEVIGMRMPTPPVQPSIDIPYNSIAVLPFVNMSDGDDNEYFSDGIAEQLLNELSRVPELHVSARTSSFYYKGRNEKISKVGAELGVRTVLEGSVRRNGSDVRISVQLINASDGYNLWSETFDRKLDDIFAVQEQIAAAIANTLTGELLSQDVSKDERLETSNGEAYDLYLRGSAYLQSYDSESINEAIAFFRRSIELAPDFALAYDTLAQCYLNQSFFGTISVEEAEAEVAPLLATALELRPDLEEAHASLGFLNSQLRRFDDANTHFETALRINPNFYRGHVNYGLSLVYQSRLKEASAAYLRALTLDPKNANLTYNLGALMMLMGRFNDGYEFMQTSLVIDPNQTTPKAALTRWLADYGRIAEAVQHGLKTFEEHPKLSHNTTRLIRAYTAIGLEDQARERLAMAQQSMPDSSVIESATRDFALDTADFNAFHQYASEQFSRVDAKIGDPLGKSDSRRAFYYGWSLLLKDQNQAAADTLYWAAGGDAGIADKTYDYIPFLKMLALAYKRVGRQVEADELLTQAVRLIEGARESGWSTPSLYVRLAEVYAIEGDTENAAKNLETAIEKGWRHLARIENGVYWQEIVDDARFDDIKTLIRTDLAEQRRRLQEFSDSDP